MLTDRKKHRGTRGAGNTSKKKSPELHTGLFLAFKDAYRLSAIWSVPDALKDPGWLCDEARTSGVSPRLGEKGRGSKQEKWRAPTPADDRMPGSFTQLIAPDWLWGFREHRADPRNPPLRLVLLLLCNKMKIRAQPATVSDAVARASLHLIGEVGILLPFWELWVVQFKERIPEHVNNFETLW